MKRIYLFLPVLMIACSFLSCSDKDVAAKTAVTAFDMQKARMFIDSINAIWVEQLKKGDSVAIASYYSPDAKIFLSNSEPVSGAGILALWGGVIRGGLTDWKFVTTDLAGNSDFLIETGEFEINDANKNIVDKGNYVVTWKMQPNGEWKLYRDVGVSSMQAPTK